MVLLEITAKNSIGENALKELVKAQKAKTHGITCKVIKIKENPLTVQIHYSGQYAFYARLLMATRQKTSVEAVIYDSVNKTMAAAGAKENDYSMVIK